ncbi:MAG: class I SAM-dependent methyltransferase [Planctomycetota bacterium]
MIPSQRPPDWLRPRGVSKGTWDYVNERAIACRYDAFVAGTPLCDLDQTLMLDHFRSFVEQGPATVLDLGCGTGRHALVLAELGFDVVAIDLSRTMLEELSAKCRSAETPRVLPLQANLVELDALRDASADHAICLFSTLGMVQGRENRRRFLRHVSRILRPGGTLLLHVHRHWAAIRERGGCMNLLRSYARSLSDAEHEFGDTVYQYRGLEKMFMHRFSAREIHADMGATGWNVESLRMVDLTGERLTRRSVDASGFFVTCTKRRVE